MKMSQRSLFWLILLTMTVLASLALLAPAGVSGSSELTGNHAQSTTSSPAATQTATIDITVNDSSNGQDSDTVDITIESQQSGDLPTDLPDSVSGEQYTAWAGEDGEIGQQEAINGFNGWFDDGEYKGEELGQQEALALFNYWFDG